MVEELTDQQSAWAGKTLFLLRELLPLMSPVGRHPNWEKEEIHAIGALATACARSSESVVLLCAYGQLWDANVISRSVCEGTLKMMYLLQSADTFKQRFREYADSLFRIGLLKDHKKAQELLSAVPDPESPYWRPIRDRLLPPDQISAIESEFDRNTRRTLDTRWGFSGLIGSLSRSNDPMFSSMSALSHGYSMSSHITHADFMGVSIAIERDFRSEERRDAIHRSHLAGLLLHQLSYLQMRLVVGYRFIDHPPDALSIVTQRIGELKESFGKAYDTWLECEYGNTA